MAVPIQVDEIGIRFTTAVFYGKRQKDHSRSFVGFVSNPQNLKMLFPDVPRMDLSDIEGYDLTKKCLKRFWTPDRMCTAIVTNISMDEKERYLVRPAVEGAVTAGYGTGRGIPAFHCVLHDGFFLVIGFESGSWPDSGSEQVVLVGPAYVQVPPAPGEVLDKTRPPKPLPPDVLDTILRLKSKRQYVSRKVKEWFAFIDWVRNIICQKQIGIRYSSVEVDKSSRCLRFTVLASSDQWEKLIK